MPIERMISQLFFELKDFGHFLDPVFKVNKRGFTICVEQAIDVAVNDHFSKMFWQCPDVVDT